MPDWPHAPPHRLTEAGAYMLTAGTYRKAHYFHGAENLSFLQDQLFVLTHQYGWELQAWALFANHYHAVMMCPGDPGSLRDLVRHLHSVSAREVNRLDETPGRKVWFQFWDTQLTYERSYLARLNYVHRNAVHHGLVSDATAYPWCSAGWFEQRADRAFFRTVATFKTDRLNVRDDFDVIAPE